MSAKLGLLALCGAALALSGCGSAAAPVAKSEVVSANPRALDALARGVAAAEDDAKASTAIEHFKAAIQTDPSLWEARYNLGVLLGRRGDLREAESELREAQRLAPNAEDVVVALAEILRRRGAANDALPALESFVRAHPEALAARIQWVGCLRESGRLEQAIEQAREVLVRWAGNAQALAELSLAHLERGETDTAELLSGEALKADERSATAARTAGLIAFKRGDDAAAFRHFARASELDPNDTTARLNMGTVLLQAGVYDRASEHFHAVLEIERDSSAARLGLAAALRGQGSRTKKEPYAEAEALLRAVLGEEPENLAALFNLAVLYADSLERPDDARPLLERFLGAAPKDHPARAEAEKRTARLGLPRSEPVPAQK